MESENIDAIKSADLSGMAKETAPKKTWFFERGDGVIFPCEEREAWDIVYNQSSWKRRDFKLVGVSDGTTYNKVSREAIVTAKKLEPEIAALEAELKRYQTAEDRLMVDEVVDMEDEADPINAANIAKVKRLRKIMARVKKDLSSKKELYRSTVSNVVKKAIAAELEKARGNIEWPSIVNIITPNASDQDRKKILNLMNGRQ